MFAPTPITTQRHCEPCKKCGIPLVVATLTTLLELDGVDYQEWDDDDCSIPYRHTSVTWNKTIEYPDHKERKFFEWGRSHGLSEETVFTLLTNNIKRISILRNTPVEFLEEMDISKGQKLILKSLMEEDWSCSFCGTYHDIPKNSCNMKCVQIPYTSHSIDYSSLRHAPKPGPHNSRSSTSLPEDYETHINDMDPLAMALSRGRRNTTGQNFGHLNCHPKYWADILPVPSKIIKLL